MNIKERAAKFLINGAKVFAKEFNNELENKDKVDDLFIDESYQTSISEDKDTKGSDIEQDKSLINLSSISKLGNFEKKLRENKLKKISNNINYRIDKIESRLFTLEGYDADIDKTLIIHDDKIEIIESRLSSLESRCRVVEERQQILEDKFKVLNSELKSKNMAEVKFRYELLLNNAKNNLLENNYRVEKTITIKSQLCLLLIILASILMGFNTELSNLLGSFFIVFLILTVFVSLIQIIPFLWKLIRLGLEEKDYDKTIIKVLRENFILVDSLEFKKDFDSYDDNIDLEELIKIEKKSLKKRALNLTVTFLVLITISLYLNSYILNQTPLYLFDIINMPFIFFNKIIIL